MTITLTAAPAPASAEAVAVHSGLAPATKVQLSPAGRWFEVLARRRRLSISISADQRKLAEEAEREAAGRVVEEESDGEEVEVGDVGQWKKQDHYALLGLSSKQWQATPEEIKKAYKKQCLKHHPDKKSSGNASDEEKADNYFQCIQKAFDCLSNPASRRLFDSVHDVDDTVPPVTKDADKFYATFGPAFEANARWFVKRPVPLLGDDSTPVEEVEAVYHFWYETKSWREFGYDNEEDPNQADSRDERRYLEKKNKAANKKKKKQEGARMLKLIDNAMASDPRLRRAKEAAKQAKLDAKKAKEAAALAEKERIQKEKEEAEAAKAAMEAEQKGAAKMSAEVGKKARRAFQKAQKRMSIFAAPNPGDRVVNDTGAMCDELKQTLPVARLQELAAIKDREAFIDALDFEIDNLRAARESKAEAEAPWTAEQHKAMEDAMRTVPKDTKERWKAIAELVPGRDWKACVRHAKEIQEKLKAAKLAAPAAWTEDEVAMLAKACSKVYPAGTQGDRWGMIAEYVKLHSKTTWTRDAKDAIAKANELKTVGPPPSGSSADAFEAFEKGKKKDRSKTEAESDPTVASK